MLEPSSFTNPESGPELPDRVDLSCRVCGSPLEWGWDEVEEDVDAGDGRWYHMKLIEWTAACEGCGKTFVVWS